MERKTRSNKVFSCWSVVPSANPNFDLIAGLHSATLGAVDDEQDEFETNPSPLLPSPVVEPIPAAPSAPMTRMQKLKAASRARERKKRADASNGRRSIPKKILERFPQDGPSVAVKGMDIEDSRVARTGFVALNDVQANKRAYTLGEAAGKGSELGFTLQEWNGSDPILIVDKNGIVCAILAGHPKADDWDTVHEDAAQALEAGRASCSIPSENLDHRRGAFAALRCGISHGGGQPHPMNLKNEPTNQRVLDELNDMDCFKRIATFSSSVMMRRAPELYDYYANTAAELHTKNSCLKRPFDSSVFCGASYNMGPETVCYVHKDNGNLPFGYCPVTPLGSFDPKKGGHLILWECHLVIEFPPGSTILLPSAVIAHSNCTIQPGETRYSFTQYSAGALFRWVNNNHMRSVDFVKSLSKEQLALEEEKNRNRWMEGLLLLPRVKDKKVVDTIPEDEQAP